MNDATVNMAKLIGREGERLAFQSTAPGATGAKVAAGFTVRDATAPVEPTEITLMSVVARLNAYENLARVSGRSATLTTQIITSGKAVLLSS